MSSPVMTFAQQGEKRRCELPTLSIVERIAIPTDDRINIDFDSRSLMPVQQREKRSCESPPLSYFERIVTPTAKRLKLEEPLLLPAPAPPPPSASAPPPAPAPFMWLDLPIEMQHEIIIRMGIEERVRLARTGRAAHAIVISFYRQILHVTDDMLNRKLTKDNNFFSKDGNMAFLSAFSSACQQRTIVGSRFYYEWHIHLLAHYYKQMDQKIRFKLRHPEENTRVFTDTLSRMRGESHNLCIEPIWDMRSMMECRSCTVTICPMNFTIFVKDTLKGLYEGVHGMIHERRNEFGDSEPLLWFMRFLAKVICNDWCDLIIMGE